MQNKKELETKSRRKGITTTKTDTTDTKVRVVSEKGEIVGIQRRKGGCPVTYKHTSVRLKIALLQLDYKNARQPTNTPPQNKKQQKQKV